MRYVALLRGINVGGNNKVDMKRLKTSLEEDGYFTNVTTYLNSGNVMFDDPRDPKVITKAFETILDEEYGLEIPVLLRTAAEIATVNKAIPHEWTNDNETKCDVLFLWPKYNDISVLDLLTIDSEIDHVLYVDGAIIWMIDRNFRHSSGMNKLVGTDLYKNMTIRNANTTRRLHKIMNTHGDFQPLKRQ